MSKRYFLVFSIAIVCIVMAFTMRVNIIYGYKYKSIKVSGGELEFMLKGDYYDDDFNFIGRTIKGNPYYLLVRYHLSNKGAANIRLSSVKVKGTTGKRLIYLQGFQTKLVTLN